jgi:hypothetical protein
MENGESSHAYCDVDSCRRAPDKRGEPRLETQISLPQSTTSGPHSRASLPRKSTPAEASRTLRSRRASRPPSALSSRSWAGGSRTNPPRPCRRLRHTPAACRPPSSPERRTGPPMTSRTTSRCRSGWWPRRARYRGRRAAWRGAGVPSREAREWPRRLPINPGIHSSCLLSSVDSSRSFARRSSRVR